MFIAEIAFSIDWFLTIPGILISCGVILLIIALIMFVVSSMKGKKKEDNIEEVAPVSNVTEPTTVEETTPEVTEIPAEEVKPVTVEESAPVTEEKIMDAPLIDTVSEEVIVPSFAGDEIVPMEEVTVPNDAPVNSEVFVEPMISNEEVIPTEEIKEQSSFEIPDVISEEEHRPIYGGADPLEATQSLPKIDVHHEPYSGGTTEATIVDEVLAKSEEQPMFTVEEPKPIVDDSFNIPEPVQTVEEEPVPEVVAIPDDEIEQL